MKSTLTVIGTIILLIPIISLAWFFYRLDRPNRINKQMALLRDDARANPSGGKSLARLIDLTHSDDSFERTAAIAYLGEVGSNAEPAVDALTQALLGNDPFNAREAARSLGEIGPDARRAIPDLIKAVEQGSNGDVGWFAAESLGHIANLNDTNVVRVLTQATNSSDKRMRFRANIGLTALKANN